MNWPLQPANEPFIAFVDNPLVELEYVDGYWIPKPPHKQRALQIMNPTPTYKTLVAGDVRCKDDEFRHIDEYGRGTEGVSAKPRAGKWYTIPVSRVGDQILFADLIVTEFRREVTE